MQVAAMTSDVLAKKPEWWRNCVYLAVLYRVAEFGQKMEIIHLNHQDGQFVEPILMQMHRDDLLELAGDGLHWSVAEKGRELLGKMVALTDRLMQFEIFNGVRLYRALEDHERGENNPNLVWDNIYDPRLVKPGENDPQATDMRIAMIEFLGMIHPEGSVQIDPHVVVFIQKLIDRELRGEDFWFQLRVGTYFQHIEQIVTSAYRLEDLLHPPTNLNQEQATVLMQDLYTAGMLEQRKRDGEECGNCHTPLSMYEAEARANGHTLTQCPNPDCQASFERPPEPEPEYECPNCGSGVHRNQRKCRGCGAHLNFGLPEGEVVETPVWSYSYEYYEYTPIGYYDPYDPTDVFLTAAMLAIIF